MWSFIAIALDDQGHVKHQIMHYAIRGMSYYQIIVSRVIGFGKIIRYYN